MNDERNREERAAGRARPGAEDGGTPGGEAPVSCSDIQSVLFEYLTRELGEGRSDLVREHLRRCETCQAAAAEIQATLDLLHTAERSAAIPERLSEAHRKRILRALMHPVLDWMYRHHVAVSIAIAVAVLAAVLFVLRQVRLGAAGEEEGIPVTIGPGPEADAVATPGRDQ